MKDPPLVEAARNGHTDIVTLQEVASSFYSFIVFPFYILKDTPLFEAARNSHTDIVRLLLENGADVNKGGKVPWKDKLYML